MRWQKRLKKQELAHLRDHAGVTTLAAFKRTREDQLKLKANGSMAGSEPCWECRMIAKKLAEHGHIDERLVK